MFPPLSLYIYSISIPPSFHLGALVTYRNPPTLIRIPLHKIIYRIYTRSPYAGIPDPVHCMHIYGVGKLYITAQGLCYTYCIHDMHAEFPWLRYYLCAYVCMYDRQSSPHHSRPGNPLYCGAVSRSSSWQGSMYVQTVLHFSFIETCLRN